MSDHPFLRGIGLGVLAGAAMGATMMKNEKNIMVNPVGGELGKSSIRVAHIGDLSCSDYDLLIDELRSFLKE